VIHAAVMGQDLRTSGDFIAQATRNTLRIAEELRIASVAFPALGTGVGGFALDECARLMIVAIRAHTGAAVSLRLVRLVLFGQPAYRAFVEVAGELLGALDGPSDCRYRHSEKTSTSSANFGLASSDRPQVPENVSTSSVMRSAITKSATTSTTITDLRREFRRLLHNLGHSSNHRTWSTDSPTQRVAGRLSRI
jgi:hypothetical protein